ncbi:MAG TPA: response regulator [Noviherbaspirillum sp.]|nr:response regulator [Noviherbaspirillum sp.]
MNSGTENKAATKAEKHTVLIVDDTPANIAVLAEHLGNRGLSVMVAQDGEEAVERARFAQPDLVLLDVMMPGIGGFEACRRLKSFPETKDIPVIFMTALSNIDDKMTAYSVGGVDFVTKPFHIEEVLARVHAHLSLRAMQRELAAQNRQLEQEIAVRRIAEQVLARRTDELARSNAELEQLAYVASHDLQEPLRMITSYLQLLEQRYKDKIDADATEFIEFAVDGAKRMQKLIDDLLSYSRLGSRAKPFQPTASAEAVNDAIRSLRVAIEEANAEITTGWLPMVMGDAAQLAQLFQNLIGNAIKFRRNRPPHIHIFAEDAGGSWCFSVKDDGIGIAPEYFDRIFVMFQRLHSRGTYQGTGIGLALCKRIVEHHAGRIWVESVPAEGSVFKFTLPKVIDV